MAFLGLRVSNRYLNTCGLFCLWNTIVKEWTTASACAKWTPVRRFVQFEPKCFRMEERGLVTSAWTQCEPKQKDDDSIVVMKLSYSDVEDHAVDEDDSTVVEAEDQPCVAGVPTDAGVPIQVSWVCRRHAGMNIAASAVKTFIRCRMRGSYILMGPSKTSPPLLLTTQLPVTRRLHEGVQFVIVTCFIKSVPCLRRSPGRLSISSTRLIHHNARLFRFRAR
ncbi:uncharacterized protein [Periplaneta americana]|uniref:uncharacterized protein n=1 Tax=Periplaneta americana TaxID=6978 RepID=UPI0037E8A2E8